ncbi:MAG: hypothetical protein HC828_02100 [Blastochloris sp.]|nr:hypothetical protein [Blastochloris sp.]
MPGTIGDHSTVLSADLSSFSAGTTVPVIIDMLKTAPSNDRPDTSRLSIFRVWTEPAGNTPADLDEQVARTLQSFTALRSWMVDLIALIQSTYDRIVANGEIWFRQPCYRARYAFDDSQFQWFEPGGVATALQRQGEALVVRGRAVTLGYGPARFDNEFNEVGLETFANVLTEPVIDADAIENRVLYLDTIPGLAVGDPYNLRGVDLYYAAEWLKVVE